MHDDEPLMSTPVFRNLDYKWSWFGLSLFDLPLIVAPVFLLQGASVVWDVDPLWVPFVLLASAAFVVLLKWRKPEGYVETALIGLFAPRRLSHKARDRYRLPRFMQEHEDVESTE